MTSDSVRDETAELGVRIRTLAERHLPPAAAAEFLGWLRPALRLEPAGEGDLVVAQLGGLPALPADEWPVWEGKGPLSHVMTLDCATARKLLPEELMWSSDDRLAFFYYDGRYHNDLDTVVGAWDASSHQGARVIRIPDGRQAAEAAPGLEPYPAQPLTAVRTLTWPSFELPWVDEAWDRHGLGGNDSDPVDELVEELDELPATGYDAHQVGGHATPQQGPVELEVEQLRRAVEGLPFAWSDPDVLAAAREWRLMLQVASDETARMMWGDVGQLYWLTRGDEPYFTWQCA